MSHEVKKSVIDSQMVSAEIKAPIVSPMVSNCLTAAWIFTPVWSVLIYCGLLVGINQILFSQTGSRLHSLVSREQLTVGWFCLVGIVWIIVLFRHPRSIHFFYQPFGLYWFMQVHLSELDLNRPFKWLLGAQFNPSNISLEIAC